MTQMGVLRVRIKSGISSIFLLCLWNLISGQIRYSIPEELEHGAFVGNIGKDLGLSTEELSSRKFRIISVASIQYLDVNRVNGMLFVNARIDREQLCGQSDNCVLLMEAVVENPVEQYRVEVKVLDLNDNSPTFPNRAIDLKIPESVMPGTRFPLERAHDLDGKNNSVRTYQLNANKYFTLDVQNTGKWKLPALVLENILDREKQSVYTLLLTAIDGGTPERSGTAHITINILDVNDNPPVFQKSFYSVSLRENVPPNSLVIRLNATDLDQGTNGEIVYSFSSNNEPKITEVFTINPFSGEIHTKGILDFEKSNVFLIHVEANDRGTQPLSEHCNVRVEITDVNDNAPEMTLNSISDSIREDAPTGTLIAFVSVTDRDSNQNGNIDCRVSPNLPFDLKSSFVNSYRLVTSALLDRESAFQYIITVTCKDRGSPPLFTNTTIIVDVSDVNDNAPQFTQRSYTVYVTENNAPESYIRSVTALDPDTDRNSRLSYTILDYQVQSVPVSSYVYINPNNGSIYSKRSFDYEQFKTFQFQVRAEDAGLPSLFSEVAVQVVVLDQNDNPPIILTPGTKRNTNFHVSRSADPGYLVTQIIASDADSGKNAQLSYHLKQASVPGLFTVLHSSGEVRSVRQLKDSDVTTQKLIIQVKDNGYPALSATTTLSLTVIEGPITYQPEFIESRPDFKGTQQLSLYIIITLGATSLILLVVIIALVVVTCPRGHSAASCSVCLFDNCCCTRKLEYQNANVNLQLTRDSHLLPGILEVRGNGSLSESYRYKIRSAPEPEEMFFTPFSPHISGITGMDGRYTLQYAKPQKTWSNEVSHVTKM
ncbi:protocadherin-10-like [Leucoraja erinacea]|uniref:protocadherin-10-like n=1 Tax=Leucoraja erinaceus TaxID=7782 RepID=UPI002457B562|nr:protocadherin-10-like [Leucoraja erinacea]